MKLFLTMSLIEPRKSRWEWKTILNVPLNETHKTTWRGLLYHLAKRSVTNAFNFFPNFFGIPNLLTRIVNYHVYRRWKCRLPDIIPFSQKGCNQCSPIGKRSINSGHNVAHSGPCLEAASKWCGNSAIIGKLFFFVHKLYTLRKRESQKSKNV